MIQNNHYQWISYWLKMNPKLEMSWIKANQTLFWLENINKSCQSMCSNEFQIIKPKKYFNNNTLWEYSLIIFTNCLYIFYYYFKIFKAIHTSTTKHVFIYVKVVYFFQFFIWPLINESMVWFLCNVDPWLLMSRYKAQLRFRWDLQWKKNLGSQGSKSQLPLELA